MGRILILKRRLYAETDEIGSTFKIIDVVDKKVLVNLASNSVDFKDIVELLNCGFEGLDNVNVSENLLALLEKIYSKKELFFNECDEDNIYKERILKNQLINIYNTSNIEKVDFKSYINSFENQKVFVYDNSAIGKGIIKKLKDDKFKAYNLLDENNEDIDDNSIILLNLSYKKEFINKFKNLKNKVICYCIDTTKVYIGPIIIKDNTGCLSCRQYEDIKGLNSNIYSNYFNLQHNIDLIYFFIFRNMLFIIDGVNKYIIKDVGLAINRQLEIDLMTSRASAKSFIIDPDCSCRRG